MNIISLPVSRVSYKILLKLYGTPPFKLTKQDMLWIQANWKNYNYKLKEESVRELLTERIDLYVNAKEYRNMYKSGLYAGHCIYRHHLQMMCYFVMAQSLTGISISGALDNFYNLYNISEDDYSRDTAYKRIQRFNWALKNTQKPSAHSSSRIKRIKIPRPITSDKTIQLAEQFAQTNNITDAQIQNALKIRFLIDASLCSYIELKSILSISNSEIKKSLAAYERWIHRKKSIRDSYKSTLEKITD